VSILIRGARLVTEIDSYSGSVLVDDGRIVRIGRKIEPPPGAEVYEASTSGSISAGTSPQTSRARHGPRRSAG
jgi:dihydroorotase-like cyclic amidohydrolase